MAFRGQAAADLQPSQLQRVLQGTALWNPVGLSVLVQNRSDLRSLLGTSGVLDACLDMATSTSSTMVTTFGLYHRTIRRDGSAAKSFADF
ncbi:hypothetical protein PG993_013368 [Apiospora rasikravindrae]|uniref:Uncharacterized protein n=1 Tax=Apiospora rasikravindrae TaxID=990691 RepID=A0ABR1RXF9_9PEZI